MFSGMQLAWLASVLAMEDVAALSLDGIRNFRSVLGDAEAHPWFRCATLDSATTGDVTVLQADRSPLLGGRRLKTIIDLRNPDEVRPQKRSAASAAFYDSFEQSAIDYRPIPLLSDTNAFWGQVKLRMDPTELLWAQTALLVTGKVMDRALTKTLEEGGLPLLYQITLVIGARDIGEVLDLCLAAAQKNEGLVFHCHKGKDRTGLVAMLLQHVVGWNKQDITASYSLSETLLDEDKDRASEGTIDWSNFRGSPPSAMSQTLAWLNTEYGSVDSYLDDCGFGAEKRDQLRAALVR